MKHIYEIALSERELKAIINALRQDGDTKLAARLDAELWRPYHESVAVGKQR